MEWTKTMDIADGETDGDGGTEKQENGGSETEGMKVKTMASTEGMKVKTMARVKADTTVWKMVSHRAGNPATTLTMIHAAATVTTDTAAGGRDA